MSTSFSRNGIKQKLDYFERLFDNNKKEEYRFEDLRVGKQLGSGGFGTVCECFISGKKYALKRFHVQRRNEKAAEESFQSEQAALKLQHRHIVRLHWTFTRDNTHFILMEYVSRNTLQEIIDSDTQVLNSKRRIKFAKHIASGLEYAHKKNIVHLDLKPANILVSSTTDECKIADFGCCKVLDENTQPTTPTKSSLTGTYSYRAPELLRGESPTVKADIYSLGICLWQMVARERPYGNENHQVIIFNVVAYNLRPKIPARLEEAEQLYTSIMTQCWDTKKESRPSAQHVYDFFTAIQ